MQPRKPRVVVPGTRGRDTLILLAVGALVVGLVLWGISSMSKPHRSRNILTGTIVEKQFTPQREEQISFSGRKIERTKQIDGEYLLKVRVEQENRIFDVPVTKAAYESAKPGDPLEFVRPPSEHR